MNLLLTSNKFKLKQTVAWNILKLAENLFNWKNRNLVLLETYFFNLLRKKGYIDLQTYTD